MYNTIEEYLAQLKQELAGTDRATVQDALSDAEEYLRTALDGAMKDTTPQTTADAALASIIERYGQPREVAAAYKDIESRTPPALHRPAPGEIKAPLPPVAAAPRAPDRRSPLGKFFGVFGEARAWGSLFYVIFALATGIAYFTWVVTGLSLSVGLLVLIIGIPIFGLFLLSFRGIALVEGRLVEALLGVRMPRRPLFSRRDLSWWQKIKNLFTERQTWTTAVYMLLQMPLGIIYFTLFITLVATSLWLVLKPVTELAWGIPSFTIGDYGYFTPNWAFPFAVIGGVLLLTATMHLVKAIGRFHGNFAKLMLVRE